MISWKEIRIEEGYFVEQLLRIVEDFTGLDWATCVCAVVSERGETN